MMLNRLRENSELAVLIVSLLLQLLVHVKRLN